MGGINVGYTPIERSLVRKGELCDFNDPEYREFLSRMTQKSSSSAKRRSEERLSVYRKNKEVFDDFFNQYFLFTDERINQILVRITNRCGDCWHSRSDKYRKDPGALVCWYDLPLGSRPRKIMANDIEPCKDGFGLDRDTVIPLIDGQEATAGKLGIHIVQEAIQEGKIGKAKLRLAWGASNLSAISPRCEYGWLTALVRDVRGHDSGWDLAIGSQAKKYEDRVSATLQQEGFELLPRILKYYYQDDPKPKFKIMDAHTKYNGLHYVIEVKHDWGCEAVQVEDYCFLLEYAGIKAIPIFISDIVSKEYTNEEGVPIFSLFGFINKIKD